MLSKKITATLLVGIMMLAGCSTPANTEEVADEGVVKIGYIGALTGGLASIGQMEKNVIEDFMEEYPEWDGKEVEIIFEDGQCAGQPAANAAQKLINVDGVKLILGPSCSGAALAAAPIAEEAGVVLFSSTATSPEITDAGDFVFRNAPSDANTSVVMAEHIADSGYTKVAIVNELTDFSVAFTNALKTEFDRLGVEVVLNESFASEVTDFRTVLQKVADSDAEVLINMANMATAAGFMTKQAAELGLELPIYGADPLSGSEYVEIAGDAAEGSIMVITAADTSRSDVADFLANYESKHGEKAAAEAYALFNFDKLNIVKMAIEEVGYDGAAIRDYLYEMEPYEGLSGTIEFDENGDSSIMPSVTVFDAEGNYSLLQ